MKRIYFLVFLFLTTYPILFAQNKVDSLYRVYDSKIGLGKQSATRQLLTYFVQQNYYDYSVNPQKTYTRPHTDMLVNLGMAKMAYLQADLDKTEQYARKALASMNEDSLLWKVACQEVLSDAYLRKGRMGDALKLVKSNYEIGKKAKNNSIVSYSLTTMSGINFSFFKYEDALTYIDEAIPIERKSTNTKRLALCLGMKSDILLKMNKIDSSLSCINEALVLDLQAQREDKVGIRLSQKADVLICLEQWAEAKSICQKARAIFKKSDCKMDEAKILMQLGCCDRHLGLYDEAEHYLLTGERMCESIGYKTLLWEVQRQLSMLYKDKNQLDKALSYYESSVANRDSVMEEEFSYQLSDSKAKFDMQEKEIQLELSKEKNRHKIVYIVLLSALLVLFVLLAIHALRIAKMRKTREEELAVINEANDKIFSIVSHDLKNPVAAQKQVLDYLDCQYDQINEQEKKKIVTMLRQSGDSLNELVLELFDWASLNSGRMEYHPIRTDLFSVVQSTLGKVSMQAKTKGVNIENKVLQNSLVYADVVNLETVIRNLLTNAVKFSHEGDVVKVMAESKENEMLVLVVDEGVGMKEETLSNLFMKSSTTSRGTAGENGAGLGLKMCKYLVETNQGNIFVQSKENEGTTISFSIPKTSTDK